MTIMIPPCRIPLITTLLIALIRSSSATANVEPPSASTEIPIEAEDQDIDICDEDAVVVIIDGDQVYVEVETETGVVWRLVPNRRIGFEFAQGDVLTVLFEIPEAGLRGSENKNLYARVADEQEIEIQLRDGLGDFAIDDPRASHAFDWRVDSSYNTPATPDVVFEPSTKCPPPKLDDIQEN